MARISSGNGSISKSKNFDDAMSNVKRKIKGARSNGGGSGRSNGTSGPPVP
jgi:hypothetical protein